MNNLTKLPFKHIKAITKNLKRNMNLSSHLNKLITIKNNDDFLLKVMNSEKPVIVNFHAEWCEPCHILTPKMQELIEPMENVDLAVVNVENNPELVHTFEVKAVPAVIAVRDGLVVDKFIGLVDANMIESLIDKLDKPLT
ncbi:thioredoxin, mitochondrial [Aethina tumida]|uniref:thioredoxin, mitochondrial n=1 Tax=Aethina tumida TaxID=116153 RepID=UPI00096B1F39|nr:thioredoxin, mitochondrial [Aethina tumida]